MEQLSAAPATYALIAVTVAASLYAFYAGRQFIDDFSCRAGEITRARGHYRLITSAMLHADPFHLALNMLALWSFGPVVESLLGADGLIVLYVGSAIAGGLMIKLNNRNNPNYAAIGASGAVSGVMLSFCMFFPLERIYMFGIPYGVPAILFAALYAVLSMHLMRTKDRIISHEGHLGGALGGVILTVLMKPELVTRALS
jgi:membrane associated rhomboid family serine protease